MACTLSRMTPKPGYGSAHPGCSRARLEVAPNAPRGSKGDSRRDLACRHLGGQEQTR